MMDARSACRGPRYPDCAGKTFPRHNPHAGIAPLQTCHYFRWTAARIARKAVAYLLLLPIFALLAPVTLLGNEVYRLFQSLRYAR